MKTLNPQGYLALLLKFSKRITVYHKVREVIYEDELRKILEIHKIQPVNDIANITASEVLCQAKKIKYFL